MTQATFTQKEFINAGCMQFKHLAMGYALYTITDGQICSGCPKVNNCSALRSLQSPHLTRLLPQNHGGETVHQEAIRRSIGIKEVRRQRNATNRGE